MKTNPFDICYRHPDTQSETTRPADANMSATSLGTIKSFFDRERLEIAYTLGPSPAPRDKYTPGLINYVSSTKHTHADVPMRPWIDVPSGDTPIRLS